MGQRPETSPPLSSAGAPRSASLPVLIKAGVEQALSDALPATAAGPHRLVEAMRYALLAPAKRVRGVLACLAAHQFGTAPATAHPIAVAIEMVHAASLVLDDLPCMDDAALRRGRPAAHRIYGEDTATLAAIGLMNEATHHLATTAILPPDVRMALITRLAAAIGPAGLVGGQEQDLREAARAMTVADIEAIHRRKTGVLFSLAAEAGAIVAGQSAASAAAMHDFGAALGLAFQTYDDVLDSIATRDDAGKDVGQDVGKTTVVSLLGIDGARARADRHIDDALAALRAAGGDLEPTLQFVTALVAYLADPRPRISGG